MVVGFCAIFRILFKYRYVQVCTGMYRYVQVCAGMYRYAQVFNPTCVGFKLTCQGSTYLVGLNTAIERIESLKLRFVNLKLR